MALREPQNGSASLLELANQLGIRVVRVPGADIDMVLSFTDDVLSLVDLRKPGLKPLYVDFVSPLRRTSSLPIARRGPFARALGRSTGTVVDATAGWGQDAFLIWLMGYRVTAIERSSVVAALLRDGLRRLQTFRPDDDHPQIRAADSITWLRENRADCVYLDPMFPPKRKQSALARRPLRVLRELVGNDTDRTSLFEAAIAAARHRVVVKRPSYALPLAPDPTDIFKGNLVHYDLYLKN